MDLELGILYFDLENDNMNRKTIYLHIGMHKTATSSIQRTLFQNRKSLMKSGYYYPEKFSCGLENMSVPFYNMFSSNSHLYPINISKNLNKEMLNEIKIDLRYKFLDEIKNCNTENIIVSAESLTMLSDDDVLEMKKFYEKNISETDIKIVIVARESFSYISSIVQETIKFGKKKPYGKDFERYNNIYKSQIDKYIKHFGYENVIIYKFEDSIKYEPTQYMLKKIGASQDIVDKIKIYRSNDGLSDKAIEILNYINTRMPMIINDKLNKYRQHGDVNCLFEIRGNKYLMSEEIDENTVASIIEDKKWLNKTFEGIDYKLDFTSKGKSNSMYVYDSNYMQDIINALDNCNNPILIKMVYEFCLEKARETEDNSVLIELTNYMELKYSEYIEINIDEVYVQRELEQKIHNNAKSKFLYAIMNDERKKDADFYRDVALLCEAHGQLDSAIYFMKLAKYHRPKGVFIKKKLGEYYQAR